MSVCLGVHAPASNLEAGSELPTCIASPNTQTCLLTVTKDCISPEQSAVRLLVLLSVPKPHYASKQSGAQLHPPHGRGATAQPRWSDRAQEAAAETAASSVRGHQQQKTTRQR